MIKIACVGLLAVFLAMTLKNVKSEYALIIGMSACILLFGASITKLEVIMESIEHLKQYVTINSTYISIILKVVGVAYISEFSANLCKDAGYSGIASQIEMFGKLSILVMSMPVLTTLLTTIQEFVDRV